MPSGGARHRSGPAPDPNALRRDRDNKTLLPLPAEGREGPTPPWPLPAPSEREAAMWADLWTMPQAVVWERQRQHNEVGLYVRRFCEAELPDSPTALSTLVRQMGDSLGLTSPGLRSNGWEIPATPTADTGPAPVAQPSSRARLTVVDDGA